MPVHVITPALLQKIVKAGVELKIAPEDTAYISKLDNYNQSLFGRGWLLSDRAAADRAAADKMFTIELSAREKAIIEILNKQSKLPSQSTPNPDSVSAHQPDSVSDHQPDSVSASRPNSDIC